MNRLRLTHLGLCLGMLAVVLQVAAGCGDDTGDGTSSGPGAGGGAQGVCGDGFLDDDLDEECDDGDFDDTDACKSDCTPNECGDGAVFIGEEDCDDANDDDEDKCTNDCTAGAPGCGNGKVEEGEDCDDGNVVDDDDCSLICEAPRCGDGKVREGEDCDDGNTVDDDACSNDCASGVGCGNGTTEGDEECDDGNSSSGDDCVEGCAEAYCGDGYAWAGEEACDDGNSDDEDFCKNDCTVNEGVESGCPGAPISLPAGFQSFELTTEGAEIVQQGSCEGSEAPEVAFQVTPEVDGTLVIHLTTDGSFDAVLYARSGSCDGGTELGCVDFAGASGVEVLEFEVLAGEPMWVFADGYLGGAGIFTIDFELTEPVISNDGDVCPGIEILVDSFELGEASSDTSVLFDDYIGEGDCAVGDGPEIVYAITPLEDGTMNVVVQGDFDVVLYTLIDCGIASSQLECSDRTGSQGEEDLLDLPAYIGETLYVVVDGYNGASGTFDMLVELIPL